MKGSKMQPIESNTPNHICTSHVAGLEVIFRCGLCPGYERRINLVTGDTYVTGLNQWSHGGVSVETNQ